MSLNSKNSLTQNPILTISKSEEFGWEFEVNDRDGEWFAGGTAPTFDTALRIALGYIRAEGHCA